LAIAWNVLQEGLCELFSCVTVERGCDPEISYAIWHSTPSDRSQRDMLRSAISAVQSSDPLMPKLCDDISWMLEKMNALTGRRNNALHAPLIAPRYSRDDHETQIEPLCRSGNPRALELANKPIVDEFKWYRDHLEKLSQFGDEILLAFYFRESGFAWPDRPQLPSRGHYRILLSKSCKRCGTALHRVSHCFDDAENMLVVFFE